LKEFEDSEKYLLESLEIVQKRDDSYLMATSIDVLLKNGEARIIAMSIPDDVSPYETILAVGRQMEIDAAKLAKLEDLVKRLTGSFTEPKRAIGLARVNIALIEGREFHDFNEAKTHLAEAIRLAKEADDQPLLARALYEMSYAQLDLGEADEVEKTLTDLFELPKIEEAVLNPVIELLPQLVNAKRSKQAKLSPEFIEKTMKATGEFRIADVKAIFDEPTEVTATASETEADAKTNGGKVADSPTTSATEPGKSE
ncbi:MAG TPA: hypothetical protein VHL11_06670, partial [Phototrophicaceae bacterium]|nr:hypothetical protein [Phototrophicaceae bacterium]